MCSAKRYVRLTPESNAECVHSNVRLEARRFLRVLIRRWQDQGRLCFPPASRLTGREKYLWFFNSKNFCGFLNAPQVNVKVTISSTPLS